MGTKLSIEEHRDKMINHTYGWLTVIDVFRDEKSGRVTCKCRCKCGNICSYQVGKVKSGARKSCGCYKHSDEFKKSQSNWCKENPDKVADRSSRFSEWCQNNQDKLAERSAKYSNWCNNNHDGQLLRDQSIIDAKKSIRLNLLSKFNKSDFELIHPDDLNDLLAGKLKGKDRMRVKCPTCGEYRLRTVENTLSMNKGIVHNRICKKCAVNLTSSQPEQEILDYIATFYNKEPIRNSRDIIAPLELDLYYPEKKIAIEYNGDYWHNTEHKDRYYHIKKFMICKSLGIILVSIFESEWVSRKTEIKQYLADLFNYTDNPISFNSDKSRMNNNYPAYSCMNSSGLIEESTYVSSENKVYTSGYTVLKGHV